jgi:hypothetical protein
MFSLLKHISNVDQSLWLGFKGVLKMDIRMRWSLTTHHLLVLISILGEVPLAAYCNVA